MLYALLWSYSSLPLRVHYLFGEIYFVLVYYLFSYRKSLVSQNLQHAFPEKSSDEIKRIKYLFYRYIFSELIPENIKSFTLSEKEIKKRYRLKNVQLLEHSCHLGRGAFVYAAHYANWEWISFSPLFLTDVRCYSAYKELSSSFFEQKIKFARQRFGAILFEMKEVFSFVRRVDYKKNAFLFLSDQRPRNPHSGVWMDFLNQKTSVIKGVEKMAHLLQVDSFMGIMRRVKKGYYEFEFIPFTQKPNRMDFCQTQEFYQLLEKEIKAAPQYWLWTHNRWKHRFSGDTL